MSIVIKGVWQVIVVLCDEISASALILTQNRYTSILKRNFPQNVFLLAYPSIGITTVKYSHDVHYTYEQI